MIDVGGIWCDSYESGVGGIWCATNHQHTKKRKEKSYLAESGVDSYESGVDSYESGVDSYLAESGIRVKFKI